MLKSGSDQSKPTSHKKLSKKPVVWWSVMPNRTFIERYVWNGSLAIIGPLAATPACRRGIPAYLGGEPTSWDTALQSSAGLWIVSEPLRFSASL